MERDGLALWANCWSFTYDRTPGTHLMAVLCASAECRVPAKKRKKLENVAITNALQLEVVRRRAVPIRFNTSPVASLKSLSLQSGPQK